MHHDNKLLCETNPLEGEGGKALRVLGVILDLIKPPVIVIAWEFGCLCVLHFSVLVRHHKS
jgi:hypothetical protein